MADSRNSPTPPAIPLRDPHLPTVFRWSSPAPPGTPSVLQPPAIAPLRGRQTDQAIVSFGATVLSTALVINPRASLIASISFPKQTLILAMTLSCSYASSLSTGKIMGFFLASDNTPTINMFQNSKVHIDSVAYSACSFRHGLSFTPTPDGSISPVFQSNQFLGLYASADPGATAVEMSAIVNIRYQLL